MLKRAEELLGALDMELEQLWLKYIKSRPDWWLLDWQCAKGQLAQMEKFRDTLGIARDYVGLMQHIISKASGLDPVRKEN